MKLVVSGSRAIQDYKLVAAAIAESGFKPTLIIEGGQRMWDTRGKLVGGVDWLALQWAIAHHIEVRTVKARWDLHGKAAGPIRNREMAHDGDALVAIPEGRARGTRDMIAAMEALGKPVYIKEVVAETLFRRKGESNSVMCNGAEQSKTKEEQ